MNVKEYHINYLLAQLDLAHRRNDLVDQLRYSVVKVLFSYHGVILGAIIYKSINGKSVAGSYVVSASIIIHIVALVGFFLYGLYVAWSFYLYRYKAWIEDVEGDLCAVLQNRRPSASNSKYYGAVRKIRSPYEPAYLWTSGAMTLMNIATPAIIANIAKVHDMAMISGVLLLALMHIILNPIMRYTIHGSKVRPRK